MPTRSQELDRDLTPAGQCLSHRMGAVSIKLVQPENTPSPMVVTLLGIVMVAGVGTPVFSV